jgi:hypothetical protein
LSHLEKEGCVRLGIKVWAIGGAFWTKAARALLFESLQGLILVLILINASILRTNALVAWSLFVNNRRVRDTIGIILI